LTLRWGRVALKRSFSGAIYLPDEKVNQLFSNRRASGNRWYWLFGNGHLHRRSALLPRTQYMLQEMLFL
jgi:hypothetical protein